MDGLGAVDFAEFSAVLFPDVKLKPEDSAADKFASAASAVIKQQQDEKKKAEEALASGYNGVDGYAGDPNQMVAYTGGMGGGMGGMQQPQAGYGYGGGY